MNIGIHDLCVQKGTSIASRERLYKFQPKPLTKINKFFDRNQIIAKSLQYIFV